MTCLNYATARRSYVCARCRKPIARGTLYAYALNSRKQRIRRGSDDSALLARRATHQRRSLDRACAPAKAQYAEGRGRLAEAPEEIN